MKKVLVSLSLLMFLFTACKKQIEELFTFTINESTQITFPATSSGIDLVDVPIDAYPLSVDLPEVKSSASGQFESNGISEDRVSSVILNKLTLQIDSPDDQNFDFLQSIKIYIKANGLSEILLAEKTDIDESVGDFLDLNVSDKNLADYVKSDTYQLRVDVVVVKQTDEDVEITADMEFDVTASPL